MNITRSNRLLRTRRRRKSRPTPRPINSLDRSAAATAQGERLWPRHVTTHFAHSTVPVMLSKRSLDEQQAAQEPATSPSKRSRSSKWTGTDDSPSSPRGTPALHCLARSTYVVRRVSADAGVSLTVSGAERDRQAPVGLCTREHDARTTAGGGRGGVCGPDASNRTGTFV